MNTYLIALLCSGAVHTSECDTVLKAASMQSGIGVAIDNQSKHYEENMVEDLPINEKGLIGVLALVRFGQGKEIVLGTYKKSKLAVCKDKASLQIGWEF